MPVAAAAWHYGPGLDRLAADDAARSVARAEALAAGGDHAGAVEAYSEALAQLPKDRTDVARRLRLERAKSQMLAKQLPEAHEELRGLVEELAGAPRADAKLLADARAAYANSQYYMTWLMRLEGFGRDEWEPEVEGARQAFKLLAEQSAAAGDAASAKRHAKDLEASIRLARMDLGELQGLPLPSQ